MISLKKPIKKVAVIHDIVSVGKAAMTNIMPVMSHMELEVCPIPTVILSTHLGGYGKPEIKELQGYISGCMNHYIENNIEFDCIFAGYLGNDKNIIETEQFISRLKKDDTLVVIDPILGDNGRLYSGFTSDYVNKLKQIIRHADVITPNLTEACMLTEIDYDDKMDISMILIVCKELMKLGCKNIVLTSMPGENDNEICTAIYSKGKMTVLCFDKIEKSYHGTGDIFASVIIGYILKGDSIEEAVKKAGDFIGECIKNSMKYDYPQREGLVLESVLDKLN